VDVLSSVAAAVELLEESTSPVLVVSSGPVLVEGSAAVVVVDSSLVLAGPSSVTVGGSKGQALRAKGRDDVIRERQARDFTRPVYRWNRDWRS
jgi:hypothetical protein